MKRTIRSLVTGLAVCAAGLAFAPKASALTVLTQSSSSYLGLVNDGIPSSEAQEAGYINTLIAQPLGSGPTQVGTEFYTRSNNTPAGCCPTATATGAIKDEVAPLNQIVVTNGAQYLIAKYDAAQAGSLVWYIGGVNDTYEVPSTLNGLGVSHITSFNPTTGTPGTGTPGTGNPGGSTPEPASLALFGLGLLGAGYRFRRRTV